MRRSKKSYKPYTFEEMSFYDDIVYDEEGLNIGYDNNPAMDNVKRVKEKSSKPQKSVSYNETVSPMTGLDYEHACAQYLEENGYQNVEVTKASGDQGIDVIATKDGKKYGIQCKYYKAPVGNKAVQEAMAGALYYKCDYAVVMTNSTFTPAARELADSIGVILWPDMDLHGGTQRNNREPLFYPWASFAQKLTSVILTIMGIVILVVGAIGMLVAFPSDGVGLYNVDLIGFSIGGLFNLINGKSKSCDYIAIGGYGFAVITSFIFMAYIGKFTFDSVWIYLVPLAITIIHLLIYIRDERKIRG